MAKATKPKRTRSLEPLTDVGREIITFVVNRIAFQQYSSCCDEESIAIGLGKNLKRLRPVIDRLAKQGWLTIEGRRKDRIYPTPAALRWQQPGISDTDAKKLVRKIRRA